MYEVAPEEAAFCGGGCRIGGMSLSTDDVRRLAAEKGVSDRQLQDWRDEGLLPKPLDRGALDQQKGESTFTQTTLSRG